MPNLSYARADSLKQLQPGSSVTKEFCLEVITNVANRQAPYFVDGEFTGEGRNSLIVQCGDRMCEWARLYGMAARCPTCPSSCGAESTVMLS